MLCINVKLFYNISKKEIIKYINILKKNKRDNRKCCNNMQLLAFRIILSELD